MLIVACKRCTLPTHIEIIEITSNNFYSSKIEGKKGSIVLCFVSVIEQFLDAY